MCVNVRACPTLHSALHWTGEKGRLLAKYNLEDELRDPHMLR